MGATQSASGGGKSPGERKAQTGKALKTEDRAKIQGLKADEFARKKLGIIETKGGFQDRNVTGYKSTTGNQLYGAEYNAARGEYLESQGLATARQVTDAMGKTRTVYDPRTADGTYTNMTRMSAQEARANKTPLSKEMYEGQMKAMGLMGAGLMFFGVPLMPSILLKKSQTPYSDYVSKTQSSGFYNYSRPVNTNVAGGNTGDNTYSSGGSGGGGGEFADETEAEKRRKKRMASSGQSVSSKERSLFGSSPQTFSV